MGDDLDEAATVRWPALLNHDHDHGNGNGNGNGNDSSSDEDSDCDDDGYGRRHAGVRPGPAAAAGAPAPPPSRCAQRLTDLLGQGGRQGRGLRCDVVCGPPALPRAAPAPGEAQSHLAFFALAEATSSLIKWTSKLEQVTIAIKL